MSLNSSTLNKAGIYEKFHDATLDKVEDEYAELAREYTNRTDGKGLMLVGENGLGKSYIVCAAFIECMERGIPVFRVHAQSAQNWYLTRDKRMKQISSAYFLCIDDFGKEHFDSPAASALSAKVWDGILRYRVERCRPTWFTSNVDVTRIRAMYGDSLASLFMEAIDVLPITGPVDRRVEKFKYHDRIKR